MAFRCRIRQYRRLFQLRQPSPRTENRPPALYRRAGIAAAVLLAAGLLCGCPGPEAETPPPATLNRDRSAGAFARTDPWLLTATDRNAARGNHGIFLGNGYLGATFGADGGAGAESVCYVAGLYHGAGEEIAPIPVWNRLDLPESATRGAYEQTLDLRRGVLVTKRGGVTVTAFLSRVDPRMAVIHVDGAPMPAEPPTPAVPDIWEGGSGTGYRIYRLKDGDTALAMDITQRTEPTGGWTRFVSVRKMDNAVDVLLPVPRYPSYEEALAGHTAAWEELWKRDIQIDGDPEAQQLVHSLMFNLLSSVWRGASDSIPPETWAGSFYKGHIFWDADVWVFPALLAQHPDLARTLLDYRFERLPEARRRAQAAGYGGADFPWESAASGREVVAGEFSKGRHVTAGVGRAHWQYWLATGDRQWLRMRGWPVLSAVADYFASRAVRDPATGKYAIKDVMGPDELKGPVNNNTYTNALARYCLLAASEAAKTLSLPANPQWADVAKNLTLPYDAANKRYLARDGDDGKATKQADGELVLYPALLPMDDATAARTFDFHAPRPIKNGPAMTASIHALLAARLGRGEQAEQYLRDSYRPFLRGPFLQFSEKRSLDRCYFATGAGGTLQSVLYGFGGLDYDRFDAKAFPTALPLSWKRLTLTGIQRHGARYTLTVTPEGRTLAKE